MDVQNKNILVVGNPANTPPGFADLPGAQQEASLVAAKFGEFQYNVISEIHTGSNSIMNSLFANDYRVLHLAGHGAYRYPFRASEDEELKIYTGMVLGDNVFLTANEIRNKMDIPELVFINCCHLGKIDSPAAADGYNFNKLAASFAQELIEMGVKAVIAAGWAVDDAAALTFADVFYDNLLKGASFGEAVKEARTETYNLHKDRTNTWGAYQCYGDPAYRLVVRKQGGLEAPDMFVDIDEAVVEIRKLSGSAKTTSAEGIVPLREGLLGLQKRIEKDCPAWLKNSLLQEALGEAFSEVFLLEQAAVNYQLALENKKCNASIKTVEQLANIRIRQAVQSFENDPNCFKESKAIIEAQIETLMSLMKTVGKTSERWSMVGSGYKRLAQISSDKPSKACDQALKKMEIAYKHAWELAKDNPYPLTNYLTARVTRLLRAGDLEESANALPELLELTEQAARLAEIEQRNAPDDFWASIGGTDVNLIGYLLGYLQANSQDQTADKFDGLVDDYTVTWRRYGSARELYSVIEHYDFLAAVLKSAEPHRDLADSLAKILSALNSISQ